MRIASMVRMGKRMARPTHTDELAVYEVTKERNLETGEMDEVTVTIYLGRGKVQSHDAYERKAVSAGYQHTVMRPHVHLPEGTPGIRVGHHVAVLDAATSATIPGSEYTIAGVSDKSHATALRFPVEEDLGK